MKEKIKSFFLGIAGLILSIVIFIRLFFVEEWPLRIFGGFMMIFLGSYGLFEIFKGQIHASRFYVHHEQNLTKHQKLFGYVFLLLGILILEILFLSFSFEETWLNLLKNFMALFFLIGASIICFGIFYFFKGKNEE